MEGCCHLHSIQDVDTRWLSHLSTWRCKEVIEIRTIKITSMTSNYFTKKTWLCQSLSVKGLRIPVNQWVEKTAQWFGWYAIIVDSWGTYRRYAGSSYPEWKVQTEHQGVRSWSCLPIILQIVTPLHKPQTWLDTVECCGLHCMKQGTISEKFPGATPHQWLWKYLWRLEPVPHSAVYWRI